MVNLEKSLGLMPRDNPYYRENPRICQALFSETLLYCLTVLVPAPLSRRPTRFPQRRLDSRAFTARR